MMVNAMVVTGSLGRVLLVAAAAGVSMEQVAAGMAVMTRTGLSADEAATSLRGTIGALLAPTDQAKEALAAIGLTTDQVAAMLMSDKGLVGVLDLLMQRTGGNIEKLDQIIPNIRALTGVLSSAGSQGAEYARVLGVMENAAGATDKAFGAMSETMEFKVKKAQNAIEGLGIAIGNKVIPVVGEGADAATVLITMKAAADGLGVPLMEIYRVASFYKAFKLKPCGKNHLIMWMGTACHVRGAPLLLEQAVGQFGVKTGEVTPDGLFSVEHVNCLGACALGPIVIENGSYHHHMTPGKLRKLIETLRRQGTEEIHHVQTQ